MSKAAANESAEGRDPNEDRETVGGAPRGGWFRDPQFWRSVTESVVAGTILLVIASIFATAAGLVDRRDFVKLMMAFVGLIGFIGGACILAVALADSTEARWKRVLMLLIASLVTGLGLYLLVGSLSDETLVEQVRGWVDAFIRWTAPILGVPVPEGPIPGL